MLSNKTKGRQRNSGMLVFLPFERHRRSCVGRASAIIFIPPHPLAASSGHHSADIVQCDLSVSAHIIQFECGCGG